MRERKRKKKFPFVLYSVCPFINLYHVLPHVIYFKLTHTECLSLPL